MTQMYSIRTYVHASHLRAAPSGTSQRRFPTPPRTHTLSHTSLRWRPAISSERGRQSSGTSVASPIHGARILAFFFVVELARRTELLVVMEKRINAQVGFRGAGDDVEVSENVGCLHSCGDEGELLDDLVRTDVPILLHGFM